MRLILERRATWAELQVMPTEDAIAIYDGITFMAAQSSRPSPPPPAITVKTRGAR